MTAPQLGMSGKDWGIVMAYYGALWPASAPEKPSADAWRTIYGDEPLDDVINALKLLASQFGRRFGPAPGEVTQALDQLRRPRPAEYAAPTTPALPAGARSSEAEHADFLRTRRNQRRSRVVSKLSMGALDIDGNPTEGYDDDPDLFAYDQDPLLAEMVAAHLAERRKIRDRSGVRTNPLGGDETPHPSPGEGESQRGDYSDAEGRL